MNNLRTTRSERALKITYIRMHILFMKMKSHKNSLYMYINTHMMKLCKNGSMR